MNKNIVVFSYEKQISKMINDFEIKHKIISKNKKIKQEEEKEFKHNITRNVSIIYEIEEDKKNILYHVHL